MGQPGPGRESSSFTARKPTEPTQEQTAANNKVECLRFHVYTFAVASSETILTQLSQTFTLRKLPCIHRMLSLAPRDAQRANLQTKGSRSRASHGIRSGEVRSYCSSPRPQSCRPEYKSWG